MNFTSLHLYSDSYRLKFVFHFKTIILKNYFKNNYFKKSFSKKKLFSLHLRTFLMVKEEKGQSRFAQLLQKSDVSFLRYRQLYFYP